MAYDGIILEADLRHVPHEAQGCCCLSGVSTFPDATPVTHATAVTFPGNSLRSEPSMESTKSLQSSSGGVDFRWFGHST